jgi:hypothetical protein
MRYATLVLFLLAPVLSADPPDRPPDESAPKDGAREIELRGVRLGKAGKDVTKPTKITNREELARAIPDEEAQAKLKKDVDLSKEYLLLFVWSSSNEDMLTVKVNKGEKGSEALFTYTAGRSPETIRHVKLYALPSDTKWKVEKKR